MILKPGDPDQMEFSCRSDFVKDEPLVKVVSEVVDSLDLGDLYSRYSECGRSFYDPCMLMKVLFFGYCDKVRSSRELYKHICYDIRYHYFCGSLRPDFRTLNRFRKDNLDLLGDYFAQIVLFIQERGLIDNSLLSLDGTKLRASANGRGKRGKRIRGRLSKVFQARLEADIKSEEGDSESRDDASPPDDSGGTGDLADPDARYMKTSEGGKRLSYNSQIVVDRNQIIVAADVSNNSDDSVQLRGMLEQSRGNLGVELDKVAADGGYYSGRNLKYASREGIDLYLPVTKTGRVPDDRFHRDAFVYDAKSDSYHCPGGQHLRYSWTRKRRGSSSRIYSGSAASCGLCQYRSLCTRKRVRQLYISEHSEYECRMTAKLRTAKGRFVYAQRKFLVEPVFGNIKFNLGFVRYALRTLAKVRGEFLLICIAHNLKKLAAHWKGLLSAKIAKNPFLQLIYMLLEWIFQPKSHSDRYQLIYAKISHNLNPSRI
jgi:transposase